MGMEFGQMHTELVVNLGLVKGFKYAEEKGRMASAYLSFGYNF